MSDLRLRNGSVSLYFGITSILNIKGMEATVETHGVGFGFLGRPVLLRYGELGRFESVAV